MEAGWLALGLESTGPYNTDYSGGGSSREAWPPPRLPPGLLLALRHLHKLWMGDRLETERSLSGHWPRQPSQVCRCRCTTGTLHSSIPPPVSPATRLRCKSNQLALPVKHIRDTHVWLDGFSFIFTTVYIVDCHSRHQAMNKHTWCAFLIVALNC